MISSIGIINTTINSGIFVQSFILSPLLLISFTAGLELALTILSSWHPTNWMMRSLKRTPTGAPARHFYRTQRFLTFTLADLMLFFGRSGCCWGEYTPYSDHLSTHHCKLDDAPSISMWTTKPFQGVEDDHLVHVHDMVLTQYSPSLCVKT